jgi:hypothetical protein
MSLFSGIARSIGSFIKPLAQTALRAIAPAATSMLSNVVGDLFSAGKGALNTFMSALPLPSPLKDLASRLLGRGMDAVQNLAQGSLEKWLNSVVDRLAPRTTADGVTVTPDTLPNRTDSITTNTPSVGGNTPAAGGTAVSQNPATGAGGAGGVEGGNFGWSGSAPNPSSYGDMSKPENANKFQSDMFKYQQAMNNLNNFWQMMSNAMKASMDTQKSIIGNLR